MSRREFIKLGGSSLLAIGGLISAGKAVDAAQVCAGPEVTSSVRLAITQIATELIDGQVVNQLAFKRLDDSGSGRVPGPVIRVVEGEEVSISISNGRPEAHGFEIAGVPDSAMVVSGGQTCRVTFTAPMAGTYLYHDGTHASRHLYRLLGLHGAFVVHPRDGRTAAGSLTPYSLNAYAASDRIAVERVGMVFDALGTAARFPGGKWAPCPLDQEFSTQEKIWLFNEIDPKFNKLIRGDGIAVSPICASDAAIKANFVPRYFTINGRSGYDLSEGTDVVVRNYIGEPTLLRTIAAGLVHHATHIHGNHVLELAHSVLTADGQLPILGASRSGQPGEIVLHDNIWERDVWPTWPMQIRDVLLPLEVPPDIPNWAKYASGAAAERFPLRYVMHDHCEMGTTAAGGNYPQGAVTHWEILGPPGGRARA